MLPSLTLPQDNHHLLRAIGYIRVSMMLGEKISPDTQKDAIIACAAREGYYIPEGTWPQGGWIVELDVSGRNFERDIRIAVQAIEDRRAFAIIVWEFARFGRDREGNPIHLGRIERAGGELLSATEDVDARTPSGRLARGIHFEFAAYYSDLVGARWSEAFRTPAMARRIRARCGGSDGAGAGFRLQTVAEKPQLLRGGCYLESPRLPAYGRSGVAPAGCRQRVGCLRRRLDVRSRVRCGPPPRVPLR
ncbi:recombinase family protein [Nonomuraea sp. NPDC055795]